jgi:TRAP-type C4-dicarboxylate transport system permease small subunit
MSVFVPLKEADVHTGDPDNTEYTRVFDWLANGSLFVACSALIIIVVVEAWQVFARYVLNDSPSWTEPVALLLMSTALMLGAAAGVRSQRHFGFLLLIEHAPPRVRRVLQSIQKAIAAGIGAMLAWWGGEMAANAWDYSMAGAALPQGAAYLPVCAGGALIFIFSVEQLVRSRPR